MGITAWYVYVLDVKIAPLSWTRWGEIVNLVFNVVLGLVVYTIALRLMTRAVDELAAIQK